MVPLGGRVGELEICLTEVRRNQACNSFVCKYGYPADLRVIRACTASRIFKDQTVETGHPPKTYLAARYVRANISLRNVLAQDTYLTPLNTP